MLSLNCKHNSNDSNQPSLVRVFAVRTHHIWSLKIENTMLVSFDIKFIRGDQKQRRNARLYLSCIISRLNGEKTAKQNEEQTQFCTTLLCHECVMTLTGNVI